jgi:hypothetical protein
MGPLNLSWGTRREGNNGKSLTELINFEFAELECR